MKKSSGSGTLSSNETEIGRRTILKSAALVVGAGAAMQSCTSTGNAPRASASYEVGESSVIAQAGTAVVEIESGKIAGAIIRRIYSFKGIPYGATTAGAEPLSSCTKTETMDRNSKLPPIRPCLPSR